MFRLGLLLVLVTLASLSMAQDTIYERDQSAVEEHRAVGKASASLGPGRSLGEEVPGPDGGLYVWVLPGEFLMGSPAGEGQDDERPQHLVRIRKGLWLGKHEVTNGQYRQFCAATGRPFPSGSNQGDDHPVVHVSWRDARAYCGHYGLRLPTEAEGEYAARGPEGRTYPWGGEWDGSKCCNWHNKGPGGMTFPVGSFPAGPSWCGALDMAGSVWEWCADWYDSGYYAQSPVEDPQGPATGDRRVMRGGSWFYMPVGCRSAYRAGWGLETQGVADGFRCAVSPE